MAENDGGNGGGAGAGDGGAAAAAAAAAGAGAGDGTGKVPASGNAPAPVAQTFPEFATLIPTEFKDKPWIKDVKDVPGMFKRFDGMLTEMGKRPAGIPADTAPEAEWSAFNKAWGVPEKPDGYQLPEVPAGLPKNEKYIEGMKGVFIKAGVNPRQAKILAEGNNALVGELLKEAGVNGEQADVDFEKLAGETFGARKDEALKTANVLIAKFVPASMKSHVANLSNENLIVLAGVLDGIRKEYISEDRLPTGGGAPVGMTPDQKRAKGVELMASKAYQDPFDPDHEKVKQEVQALYGTK